jgi:ferredoxin-NADP reductase
VTGEARPEPLRWQSATIVAMTPLTSRVIGVVLAPEKPFAFRPGQHADVRLTAPDGYQARRSYSIVSAPEAGGRIELAIERLDEGEVSPFFHEVAQIGDTIEVRGPIGGHFVWDVSDGGPLVMIGAGSGVAPLMAMIRRRAAERADTPALLMLSASAWSETIFRAELLALHDRRDGFELVLTLTQEAPRRPVDHGRRIDGAMIAEALDRLSGPPRHAFVCGSNAFVETAAQGLIDAAVPAGIIRTERYGG